MDEITPTERWIDIPGYVGTYQVSDMGRVRSLDREIMRRNGRPQWWAGRLLKPGYGNRGHPWVNLCIEGKPKSVYVHALVLLAFVGPRPEGLQCCHNDGNPLNNVPDNLRYDTIVANRQDSIKHGTDHNLNKTHCPRNHPLVMPNLTKGSIPGGFRACLACSTARGYAWKRGTIGEDATFSAEEADACFERIMSVPNRGERGQRTHCPREHLLAEPNLVPSSLANGQRNCLACVNARSVVKNAARKGVVLDFKAVADRKYEEIMQMR